MFRNDNSFKYKLNLMKKLNGDFDRNIVLHIIAFDVANNLS